MKRITQLRMEKNLSQIALSMKLNVSQKTISAYENGKSDPSISVLKKMAEIFGTSVDYIIGYTDIKAPIDRISQTRMTERECEVLNKYRALSSKNQDVALGVLLGLENSEKRTTK